MSTSKTDNVIRGRFKLSTHEKILRKLVNKIFKFPPYHLAFFTKKELDKLKEPLLDLFRTTFKDHKIKRMNIITPAICPSFRRVDARFIILTDLGLFRGNIYGDSRENELVKMPFECMEYIQISRDKKTETETYSIVMAPESQIKNFTVTYDVYHKDCFMFFKAFNAELIRYQTLHSE